jgi:hypothetical protein
MNRRTILGLLAAAFVAGPVWAMYIRPDTEKVPVKRLADNIEEHLKKNPKDTAARLNLARLHAMAYSLKTDTAEVNKRSKTPAPWFGYEPRPVPFDKVQKTDDAGKQDAARKHLEKAIALYNEVVKEKPADLIAQLGRAWAIAQRGNKEDAIREYRKVEELAWKKEKDVKSGPLGWHPVTAETANYLIPLLDPQKDKDEIATLKKRTAQVQGVPRPVTPIALPLRDNLTPAMMLNPSARVKFDADGSGLPRTWTWTTRDAAWLVHDPKHTGKITSSLQMFGGVSFWCFWDNGYQALAALDDNGDGWLRDQELAGLALWHDTNGNGVCDPGEVRPLSAHGIVALRCRADAKSPPALCAASASAGVVYKDSSTRPTFDLILERRD